MHKVEARNTTCLVVALLLAGLWLRVHFLRWHPFVAGDSSLYLDIAQSWIDSHTYGLSTNTVPRPTLIRLPGYPMLLAAVQLLVPSAASTPDGRGIFAVVEWLQAAADLGTCALLSNLAWRNFGRRAGLAALALAALCPFLANYTAVPLTECLVIFFLALAYWAADRWRHASQIGPGRGFRTAARPALLLLTAFALGYSILLRPDQGLLAAAVLPLFLWPSQRTQRATWRPALLCAALTVLPLVPWTVRNARTFHVFQPLSPKSATDPGEPYARGFPHWYRTFAVDFSTTEDAYWNYPENAVDPGDLPSRAFDSTAQRDRTVALLARAATTRKLNPTIEGEFESLARERIHAHRLRYYAVLPAARLVNMLLHPRVEMLPVDERWWRLSLHPAQTLFAAAFGLLNLAYMVAAACGTRRAWRRAPALTASMLLFLLLRCALLLTLDNAEQRYTLEFLPIWIVLASACLAAPAAVRTQARAV